MSTQKQKLGVSGGQSPATSGLPKAEWIAQGQADGRGVRPIRAPIYMHASTTSGLGAVPPELLLGGLSDGVPDEGGFIPSTILLYPFFPFLFFWLAIGFRI